ncbi:phage protein Gp13 family protein [Bradyrhizobium sp. HKCCYLS2038]|uniref:phage protein Gp13 family protein n=1 Tax=Bradyrhizobium sp. HKCCYLS2038 TaxID=3420764 RepID=UPI003EC07825
MRQADRDEVMAASGKSPAAAVAFSLRRSAAAWTALIDGRPEVMFGVADLNILAGIGAPWLLGTDAVERHNRQFLRRSVRWRDQLLQRYSVLRNFVDDRNTTSVRWLRWLGFRFSEPVMFNGQAFRAFELRSEDVRYHDGAHDRLDAPRGGRGRAAGAGRGGV